MILIRLLRNSHIVNKQSDFRVTSYNCRLLKNVNYVYNIRSLENTRYMSSEKNSVIRTENNSTVNLEKVSDQQNLGSNIGSETKEEDEYITIYINPAVKYLSLINKLVYYPTFLGISAIPVGTTLYTLELISLDRLQSVLFLAIWFTCVLNIMASNNWRKVGFLYVNKEMTELKVSYVTYWGRRDNVVLPINRVMALSDIPKSPFDLFYRKVKTFDSKLISFESYKIDHWHYQMVKPELFEQVFGPLK